MSPPLLGVGEDEGLSNVTMLASSTSAESVCPNILELRERNYMGLSDSSSGESSLLSTMSDESKSTLNLKATELRLGLPGSQSPPRDPEPCLMNSSKLDEKPLFPLHPLKDTHCFTQKTVISGNKRGFSDAMDAFPEGKFLANSEVNVMLSPRPSLNSGIKPGSTLETLGAQPAKMKDTVPPKMGQERLAGANDTCQNNNGSGANNVGTPATKAQVVGWPPIRSYRKNSLATTSKNTDEVDGKAGTGAQFVKVSMDGAPYLRKVDLKTYSAYQQLSSALEKMFSCFTIGQYGSEGALGKEMLSESKLKDLLHGSEYVLAYEDKDGDWMLVGDVPWVMFTDTCKRLRIMKGSDAIGLAPRAMEKCKNRN